LEGLAYLCLEDFSVIGNYVRYNEKSRNFLKDYYVRIARAVKNKTKSRENYILWGPPSTGKTLFVEETAHAFREDTNVIYHPLNLSKMTQAELSQRLQDIACQAEKNSLLCLIDEVDSKISEQWPFEVLVSYLDLNISSKAPIVWILVGSSGQDLDAFLGQIKSCHKGEDVVSRIPKDHILSVPLPEVGDRLLTCLSEIDRCSKAQNKKISFVEKFALLYLVISRELDTLRQVREYIWRAVSRVGVEDDRLKYDHLFEPGDKESKEFWVQYRERGSRLLDTYLRFSLKRET